MHSSLRFSCQDGRARVGAAIASIAVMAALGLALLFGLRVTVQHAADQVMTLFEVPPPPPPPPPSDQPSANPAATRSGAASEPARKAKAAPIIVPKPVVPIPAPSIAVSLISGVSGAAPAPGATETDGPGSGAAGEGDGDGSGASGTGAGAGLARPSLRLSGAITNRDYPAKARRANAQGVVAVTYIAGIDGRAHDCTIARSSGNDALDAQTCALIEKRFRFRPARDAAGRPVAETRGWQQRWWFAQ